jgi:hypothetical protein
MHSAASEPVPVDAQHQAERVGDEVALAALDPLTGVEAHFLARFRAGSDTLAIDDRGGRALVAAHQFPAPPVEYVVDAVQTAAAAYAIGSRPPSQVEDRVHHPAQASRPRSPTRSRSRQQRRQQRPFPICHVACIAPARAHMVAPGVRRASHPLLRRLSPEAAVNQAGRSLNLLQGLRGQALSLRKRAGGRERRVGGQDEQRA